MKQTKLSIINDIYKFNPQYQLKDVTAIVNLFVDKVSSALKDGKNVEIRGLGVFECIKSEKRTNARNFANKTPLTIDERLRIRFKPSINLKTALKNIPIQNSNETYSI